MDMFMTTKGRQIPTNQIDRVLDQVLWVMLMCLPFIVVPLMLCACVYCRRGGRMEKKMNDTQLKEQYEKEMKKKELSKDE